MLQIWPVPIFSDNYVWILEREGSNRVAVVDPGDGEPVIEALSRPRSRGCRRPHHPPPSRSRRWPARAHPPLPPTGLWIRRRIRRRSGPPGCAVAITISLPDLDLGVRDGGLPGSHHPATSAISAPAAPLSATRSSRAGAGGCSRAPWGRCTSSLTGLAELPPETMAYCAHEYTAFQSPVRPRGGAGQQRPRARARDRRGYASRLTADCSLDHRLRTRDQPVPPLWRSRRCAEPPSRTPDTRSRPVPRSLGCFGVWKDGWSG